MNKEWKRVKRGKKDNAGWMSHNMVIWVWSVQMGLYNLVK